MPRAMELGPFFGERDFPTRILPMVGRKRCCSQVGNWEGSAGPGDIVLVEVPVPRNTPLGNCSYLRSMPGVKAGSPGKFHW